MSANDQPEKKPLYLGDETIHDYKIVEPKQQSSGRFLKAASPFTSRNSAFGSNRLSSHEFNSTRSVSSRISHRLAHAKPNLQSSWVNVATPVPVGASYLGLDQSHADRFKSQHELDNERMAPPDRWNLVYVIFIINGIGTLLPWNMFLTANSYFTEFKLAPGVNETESEYAKNFLSYLGITAQLPNLILNAINIFCQCSGGGKPTTRIAASVCVLIVMFVVTVVLAIIDSSDWPGAFFGLTMASVVIINMACGIYQSSIFGLAGVFPMKYTNAVILGNNISGTLTAVIMIFSLMAAPNVQLAAIWYFIAAVIVLCVALDINFVLPFLKFYKHFTGSTETISNSSKKDLIGCEKTDRDSDEQENLSGSDDDSVSERPPYVQIFKKIWLQVFGVWLTFFVSLVCFPVMQAGIRPSDPNIFLPEKFYTPVSTFLFFNLFASLGNLATEWIRKPGPRFVIIPIVLRLLFIPFFLFCNFRPDVRSLPVYIDNDYAYFAGAIVMALTSGYFSSLCMMYAPSLVEPKWAGTAAMISAFFLILGIVCGVNFTLVVARIAEIPVA